MMTQLCIWKIFLFSLWMHFDLLPILDCNAEIEQKLSKQDFVLIQDEENPKCFTRTMVDFTCFFETTDNGTYDFLYNIKRDPSKKCKMSTHGTENGTFLHVCSFPRFDIFSYVGTEVKVVDRTKNITLYKRTVHVEELCLLDPPSTVSLQPRDTVGKMLVSLDRNLKHLWKKSKYRIHYSSKTLGEKTVEGNNSSFLLTLEPGEEVEVQASVKCANSYNDHPGYWSAWSKPVRAIVPQSADDISLICFTSDLQHVTCHWNSNKYGAENDYKLFYNSRQASSWTECQDDGNLSDTCSFRGDESGPMEIKLSSNALKRLFFSKEIELKKSIKSGPPSHLKGKLINNKLHLEWEAPLPSLSNHMKYEVNVHIEGVENYTMTKAGNTSMCVSLSSGSQFSVRVRAQPDGSIYSGYWSDWSDVLSGTNSDIPDMKLLWCLISMPIILIFFITTIVLYRRTLKLLFWPPVPNLEKVLQGFLTDINQQKWDPPVTSKLYIEETTSSVVEIMSGELPKLDKPSEELDFLSSDGSFSFEEQADGSDGSNGSETLRDYVTLNKVLSVLCLKENCYVYEQFKDGKDPEKGDSLSTTCHCLKPCSCNNYFNHSYLPLSQSTDGLSKNIDVGKDKSNPYANLSLD